MANKTTVLFLSGVWFSVMDFIHFRLVSSNETTRAFL